jgi:hypothetical protein
MHELLKKFWKDNENAYVGGEPTLIQPMTFWFEEHPDGHYRDEATGVKGFIFEDHIGLQTVKNLAGEGLYVYALRHGDDWCEPASIEKMEVVVNFYAYFVTDQPLDYLFKDDKVWAECLYDWSVDWNGEPYWE